MDVSTWQRVRELFDALVDTPIEQRATRLDALLAQVLDTTLVDQAATRAEVLAMLAADAQDLLKTNMDALAPELLSSLTEADQNAQQQGLSGLRLGAFSLVRELGRGGMGTVWLADRADGEFAQQVAIKLIQPGWHAAETNARFRAERQILAGLTHPNIAHLIDGGMTADGRPWLALEYVDGLDLSQYCDQNRLNIAQRLQLFLTVCDAVSHAHARLIVHRDLKPSNILVTARGAVKLLDFGIAKLIEPDAQISQTRSFTPEYAAPEQVRGEVITTSVDVYALGLLLYGLLTGKRPYKLQNSTPAAYERAILDQKPTRPSAAVTRDEPDADRTEAYTQLNQALAEPNASFGNSGGVKTGTNRAGMLPQNLSPERLKRELQGDLDAIVLKALRKSPIDRYASVADFAADISNYLEHRPVSARLGNFRYVFSRFIARHALASGFASLALVSLAGGLGSVLWQADVARHERDVARREALTTAKALSFMKGVFQLADPAANLGRTVTAVDLLDKGKQDISYSLKTEPAVRAAMLNTLGEAYLGLGLAQESKPLLEEAVSDARRLDAPLLLARSLAALGSTVHRLGDARGKEAMLREALALPLPTDDSGETLRGELELSLGSMLTGRSVYPEAETWFRAGFARLERTNGNPEFTGVIPFSALLHSTQRVPEATTLLNRALSEARIQLPAQHPAIAALSAQLATNYVRQNQPEKAEPLLREALKVKIAIYGDNHPSVDLTRHNLARVLTDLGRYAESEAIYRQVLASETARDPDNSSRRAASEAGLARALLDSGRAAEAEPLWRSAQASAIAMWDELDAAVGITAIGLGRTLRELKRPAEALEQLAMAERVYSHLKENGTSSLATVRIERTRVWLKQATRPIDCSQARQAYAYFTEPGVKQAYAQVVLGACLAANGEDSATSSLLTDGLKTLRMLQTEQWPERHFAEATWTAWGRRR